MPKTSIEWTDVSWPVVNGCRRKSPGCENCYAERLAATRLSKTAKYRGLAVYGQNGPRWTGESRLWVNDLDMPLRLKKPSRIFVADMGDLFYERVTNEEIAAVFGVMAAAPRHTFQVLTKRPERMLEWFKWVNRTRSSMTSADFCTAAAVNRGAKVPMVSDACWWERCGVWPLPNVHIGVSVEDQQRANERIPLLLQAPAALRFLSVEPLLEPVQLQSEWLLGAFDRCPDETNDATDECRGCPGYSLPGGDYCGAIRGPKVDWLVVGGESGPGSRPCHVDWIRSVVRQCQDGGVPTFVKQLGSRAVSPEIEELPFGYPGKGNDPAYWPEDLRVREFPR